jgi:hypothetical protein
MPWTSWHCLHFRYERKIAALTIQINLKGYAGAPDMTSDVATNNIV